MMQSLSSCDARPTGRGSWLASSTNSSFCCPLLDLAASLDLLFFWNSLLVTILEKVKIILKKFKYYWGSYRGILVMYDWLILYFMKREFRKLIFVNRDVKILRDLGKTWIIDRCLWLYHSTLPDFEMQVFWMVRVVYREWLGYAICNKEPWMILLSSSTLSSLRTGH